MKRGTVTEKTVAVPFLERRQPVELCLDSGSRSRGGSDGGDGVISYFFLIYVVFVSWFLYIASINFLLIVFLS